MERSLNESKASEKWEKLQTQPSLLRRKKGEFSISLNINFASLSIFPFLPPPALSPPHGFDHFNVVNSSLSLSFNFSDKRHDELSCVSNVPSCIICDMCISEPLKKKCKLSQSIKPPQPPVTRDIAQFFSQLFFCVFLSTSLDPAGIWIFKRYSSIGLVSSAPTEYQLLLCYSPSSIEREYPSRIFDVSQNKFKKRLSLPARIKIAFSLDFPGIKESLSRAHG